MKKGAGPRLSEVGPLSQHQELQACKPMMNTCFRSHSNGAWENSTPPATVIKLTGNPSLQPSARRPGCISGHMSGECRRHAESGRALRNLSRFTVFFQNINDSKNQASRSFAHPYLMQKLVLALFVFLYLSVITYRSAE